MELQSYCSKVGRNFLGTIGGPLNELFISRRWKSISRENVRNAMYVLKDQHDDEAIHSIFIIGDPGRLFPLL